MFGEATVQTVREELIRDAQIARRSHTSTSWRVPLDWRFSRRGADHR